jgi:hypothetical protein
MLALTRAGMLHWPHKERGAAITLVRSDTIPVPRRTNETTPHSGGNGYEAHRPNTDPQDARTIPATTGWDPWQGSRPRDLPSWRSTPTPMIGVVALSPMKRPGEWRPRAATYHGYSASGNLETTVKTMTDTALHRIAEELSPWLQCCHDQHNSSTSDPAVTWPPNHDDSHAQTSSTRRRSLHAKLARTSVRLSTLRSREPTLCIKPCPELYIRTARAPISGHGLILHPLPLHPFTIAVGLLELPFGLPLI